MTKSSNPTDRDAKKLRRREHYIAKHRLYLDYLLLLLDRACLPTSTLAQPNLTSMAAMVEELRKLKPDKPQLNGIVLGRFLHRVLSPLLTWHGGAHVAQCLSPDILLIMESTVYRFPEVGRSRATFERFCMGGPEWSNDLDQWQGASPGDEL